ncbi:MAG: hypothetical protein R2942_12485 [Ignavibacteria bacterium]
MKLKTDMYSQYSEHILHLRSPTEEENSKERDGELLSIARKKHKIDHPVT